MAKTCPTAGKSNVQAVWACIEDVSGILQKPTAADFIVPRGNASMTQTPGTSASEELSETLNAIDIFQNAVDPGEASIPMYLRIPASGHMQGHALMLAAMGRVQEPGTVAAQLDGALAAADADVGITGIEGGFFPPRGVVTIEDEKILYTGITCDASGVVSALTGVTRGYAGTTAAAHDADTQVSLLSRVYRQDICRNTVSLWMKNDNVVTFGSGGVVTMTGISLSNENGQAVDFTVQFRRMGWAGRSFLSTSPSGAVLHVVTSSGANAAQAYSVGAYIKNTTQGDDNSGAGYAVTAVDADNGTITLAGAPTGWVADDQIDAWTPESAPIGDALESRSARLFLDGASGKVREGSLSIGTPTEFLREIGDEYPGESVDTKREISMTMNGFMRADDARELGRGYNGYEVAAVLRFGKTAMQSLSVIMPRVRMTMPEIGVQSASFTLDRNGTALGVKGEDALYLVQE